jgi:hypothetical protein
MPRGQHESPSHKVVLVMSSIVPNDLPTWQAVANVRDEGVS